MIDPTETPPNKTQTQTQTQTPPPSHPHPHPTTPSSYQGYHIRPHPHFIHHIRHPHPQVYHHRIPSPNPRGTHVRPHIQFPYPPRGSPSPHPQPQQLQQPQLGPPSHPGHQLFQAHYSHYPPTGGPGMRPISVNHHPNHNNPYTRPKVGSGAMSLGGGGGAIENNDHTNLNANVNVNINNNALNKGVAGDGVYVALRDRQVRMSEGSSIYALCRSWLKNGSPEESQAQYGGVIKSLPKPSPVPVSGSYSPKANESGDEAESDKDEISVENLNAKELLKRHVKRAKRVRARLREERLRRIARYKNRLGLLLPPLLEQCGNDTNIGETDLFERARD